MSCARSTPRGTTCLQACTLKSVISKATALRREKAKLYLFSFLAMLAMATAPLLRSNSSAAPSPVLVSGGAGCSLSAPEPALLRPRDAITHGTGGDSWTVDARVVCGPRLREAKEKVPVFFPARMPTGKSNPGFIPIRLMRIMSLMELASWLTVMSALAPGLRTPSRVRLPGHVCRRAGNL